MAPRKAKGAVLCRRCRQPYEDHDQELDFPGLPPSDEVSKRWFSLADGMHELGDASWSEKACLACIEKAREIRKMRSATVKRRSRLRRRR